MNLDLMKSNMKNVYKNYIKLLYMGIDKKTFPSSRSPVLYRGAQISKNEIRKIFKYKDTRKLQKIIVFSKAFLSFSKDEQEARKFINLNDKETRGVLFCLVNLNCNNESKADVQKLSAIPEEKEILFFPGSSFLITDIFPMNDGVIIINLIYFGKFREMYNMIYNDEVKVNRIIETNCLTKTIAGKKLEFLGSGQFLIIDNALKIHKENSLITRVMKAKDLVKNEIVLIKEIKDDYCSYNEKYFSQMTFLLKKSNRISNHSCSLKSTFKSNNRLYMVVEPYNENLSDYLDKNNNKGLPPNLIKKIIDQLISTLKGLEEEIGQRFIDPGNILIKYTNPDKNNFDVFLSENAIYEFENDFYSFFFYHPDILGSKINFSRDFNTIDKDIKIKYELFSIGMTIYELFMNKINHDTEIEHKLFDCFIKNKISLSEINYNPSDFPFINEINTEYNTKISIESSNANALIEEERKGKLKKGLIKYISNKRNNWLKELKKNISEIDDKLLIDLIDDLTCENSNIKNYNDLYNHEFFSQYNY